MASPMSRVNSLVSADIGNYLTNKETWGGIIYNVKAYGAKGDGVTDDAAAINAALSAAVAAGGGTIVLPDGQYFVSTTIIIPAKCTLMGMSMGSSVGGGSVQIIGALSVSPIVELNGGGASSQTSIRNVSVTRVTGTIPSGAIGVKVNSSDYSSLVDVNIFRHAIGLDIEGNLGCNCERVIIYAMTEIYCIINNMPQVTFINCSFGRNGGELGIGPATDMIQIKGAADTVSFIRCQMNSTVGAVVNGINFKGYGNVNGYIYFDTCHLENMQNTIVSDAATTLIPRLIMHGCSVSNGTSSPFVALNAATEINEWIISNSIINGTTTFNSGGVLNLTGNRFSGTVTLDLTSANVTGNIFNTFVTLNGNWTSFVFACNIFDGASQTITDNSTGNKSIFSNVTTNGVNKNIITGDYITLGAGISFGVKRFTGTLDGAGSANVVTGITSSHQAGLICQAFYKGGSGEMKPLTISFIDGTTISISGGTASAKYRVTLMYSDSLDAW